jgi:hypothetical protein
MRVLVDTCIWSLFLRRKNKAALNSDEVKLVDLLREAAVDGRVAII